MGLFDRMEGRLERAVNGIFARAFRAEVQPVEISSAIRRAMDDRAAIVNKGRSLVPNIFTIELSDTDYERLSGYSEDLEEELVAAAEEHADTQRYQSGGPVRIILEQDPGLETGVFRVRPSTAKRPTATGTTGQQPQVGAPEEGYAGARTERAEDRPAYAEFAEPYADPEPGSASAPSRGAGRTAAPGAASSGAAGSGAAAPAAGPGAGSGAAGSAAAAGALAATEAHRAPAPPPPPPPRRVNPADRPWLDVDGERYPLMGARTVLGRDDSADIILDDPGISRRHTEIRVTSDGPHLVTAIRDLGSTNGTFVNGQRVSSEHLQDGDRITVGRTSVTYRAGRR
ncbi:MAG TPA: DUF3662 and FHA domain-containing protein [Dermatophilaceae bacterium]|nr:DUF3662 and FHA domain-containing protein [Dermatophilaceae bacterium]